MDIVHRHIEFVTWILSIVTSLLSIGTLLLSIVASMLSHVHRHIAQPLGPPYYIKFSLLVTYVMNMAYSIHITSLRRHQTYIHNNSNKCTLVQLMYVCI